MTPEYFTKHNVNLLLPNRPSDQLGLIVVIPSYNEPNLRRSLESIMHCQLPNCAVEVIVVVNYPENSGANVKKNALECVETVDRIDQESANPRLRFFSLLAANLPKKQAGVGLARKMGMDQAALRFFSIDNPKGIISCYDADSDCMPNYLVELERLWQESPRTNACSIRYEHPVEGDEFDNRVYNGIAQYELHLRYYNQASRLIKFPFAYHTIGSSMACCAESYVKFGGMNRHQAGEDFYFLQKIIPHGNFKELNTTCVFPSPRPSYRVPFGTGRAMQKYLDGNEDVMLTYDFEVWKTLVPLFQNVELIYGSSNREISMLVDALHPVLKQYLISQNCIKKIEEIKGNTTTLDSFRKRFFFWFDAFMLLKYLNFAHESFFERKPVLGEAKILARELGFPAVDNATCVELLKVYREVESNSQYKVDLK